MQRRRHFLSRMRRSSARVQSTTYECGGPAGPAVRKTRSGAILHPVRQRRRGELDASHETKLSHAGVRTPVTDDDMIEHLDP